MAVALGVGATGGSAAGEESAGAAAGRAATVAAAGSGTRTAMWAAGSPAAGAVPLPPIEASRTSGTARAGGTVSRTKFREAMRSPCHGPEAAPGTVTRMSDRAPPAAGYDRMHRAPHLTCGNVQAAAWRPNAPRDAASLQVSGDRPPTGRTEISAGQRGCGLGCPGGRCGRGDGPQAGSRRTPRRPRRAVPTPPFAPYPPAFPQLTGYSRRADPAPNVSPHSCPAGGGILEIPARAKAPGCPPRLSPGAFRCFSTD